jgi:hypothetical protein
METTNPFKHVKQYIKQQRGEYMVEFEAIETKEIKFGKNKFIEVAKKKAKLEDGKVTEFISISKGFINDKGAKIFKGSIGFPIDKELITNMITALQALLG